MADSHESRTVARPWIWEVVPGYRDTAGYRWVQKHVVLTNDETGVTIRYRPRLDDDDICGARTVCPGYPKSRKDWRGVDYSQPYEVVCNVVGDHGEMPHVGGPADCVDMVCDCKARGCYHLVLVSVSIARPRVSQTGG